MIFFFFTTLISPLEVKYPIEAARHGQQLLLVAIQVSPSL